MGLNFLDYGSIDTSVFSIDNLDWDNEFTRQRTKAFNNHKNTSIIPLMWSLEGLEKGKEYISPKTEFFKKYYNEKFFSDLLKQVNGTYFVRILLANLHKRCVIPPHADGGESLLLNRRIHVPIVTNENIIFTVGGESRNLKTGEIVEINNRKIHGVKNNSDEDRIHLIVDIYDEDSINN